MKNPAAKPKKETLLKILPFIILVAVATAIAYMYSSTPEPQKRQKFEKPIVVKIFDVVAQDIQTNVDSYGNIEAKTTGNLVSQVSGLITQISPNLETGGRFKKGDVLAQVDDNDYRIEVTIAQAELANAQLALQQEQAQAQQARINWNKINPNKKPSDLVIRKPQVDSAKAKLDAAKARLEKAKLALKRTKITAPYDGRVITKNTDIGQLVTPNATVARIFSSKALEVRLPVPANRVRFLPDDFSKKATIELTADFGNFSKSWEAQLDRSDSTIDGNTRQWFVTATIDGSLLASDPYLKVGQFVNAKILGKTLSDAIVIPSSALYDNNLVYLYLNGRLARRSVDVYWQGNGQSVIASGLDVGDKVISSPLSFVSEGAKLSIKGEAPSRTDMPTKAQSELKSTTKKRKAKGSAQ